MWPSRLTPDKSNTLESQQYLINNNLDLNENFSQNWVCKRCSLLNNSSVNACVVCGNFNSETTTDPNQEEYWSCERCTLHVPVTSEFCIICESKRNWDISNQKPCNKIYENTLHFRENLNNNEEDQINLNKSEIGTTIFSKNMGKIDSTPTLELEDFKKLKLSPLKNRNMNISLNKGLETNTHRKCSMRSKKICRDISNIPSNQFNPVHTTKKCKENIQHTNLNKLKNIGNVLGYPFKDSCPKRHENNNEKKLMKTKSDHKLENYTNVTEEEQSLNKWKNIVSFCKEHKKLYIDKKFPPTSQSLYNNPDGNKKFLTWRRPKDTISGDKNLPWVVFRKPVPSDVLQGNIDNCWFISSLAVLAERKELLENIMVTKEICPQGVYQVRLCKNGVWTIVTIDDLLPCDKERNLIYSNVNRKQLWVPLIEKAMAKIHGSYESLIFGAAIEGLSTLTGAPCEKIILRKYLYKDTIWNKLISCRQSLFLMVASSGGDGLTDEEIYSTLNLETRHCYSVLDVREPIGLRLIRLRNPHGYKSWNGDWSEDSLLWTPELRHELMPDGYVEGEFWISYDDMVKYFERVDVCKVRSDWEQVKIPGRCVSNISPFWILLTILEPTEVEFQLFQESHRKSQQLVGKSYSFFLLLTSSFG